MAEDDIGMMTAWNNTANNIFHMPVAEKCTVILIEENLSSDIWIKNMADTAALDTKTIRNLYGPIGTYLY